MSDAAPTAEKAPALRFPEFTGQWIKSRLDDVSTRRSGHTPNKQLPEYWDGGIKWVSLADSDKLDRGLISFTDKEISLIGISNSSAVLLPEGAVILSRDAGVGKSAVLASDMAVSQHFIAWLCGPDDKLHNWFLYYWLQIKKEYFERQAVGSTIKTIGLPLFKKLTLFHPRLREQRKIARFICAVDTRTELLRARRAGLQAYKRGVLERIFTQELRFAQDDGSPFPNWQRKSLGEVLIRHGERSTGNERVHSVSVHKGVVDQIKHLGRSYAAANTDDYNLAKPGDIIYTKSPTGDFPFGIVKQNRLSESVIVSPLYGVFSPKTYALGYILNDHFQSVINTHNYLHRLVQKGAKNTISITDAGFLTGRLTLPVHAEEQQKIAGFLGAIDAKIYGVAAQIVAMQRFKKALLQQMFV